MQIKIISFNIWDLPFWFVKHREERFSGLVEYLKKIDADIICLQESFDPKHRQFLRESLKDKYEMAGGEIKSRHLLFFKIFDETGGLVIFSKYPILESQFTPHSRFFNFTLGEILGRKGFLNARVRTPSGDIRVINTHLHEETFFYVDRAIRLRQLSAILKNIDGEKSPAILVGDLNQDAINHQEDFAGIFESTGFNHPLHPHHLLRRPTYRLENPYVEKWFNRTRVPKRFDYILVRGLDQLNLRATYYKPQILEVPLSDHDPLLLKLI